MYLWDSHLPGLEAFTHQFNQSISFDKQMYREDIVGSLAHVKMLHKIGVLKAVETEVICEALSEILSEIEAETLEIDLSFEDIHSFVEGELTRRVGDLGKKLHTARSRNDQCALDLRLYAKRVLAEIKDALLHLGEVIVELSKANMHTIMPGFTHMQHAQVMSFAHYILAYGQMFLRDLERLEATVERMDQNPLGACALATTSYPIDRFYTTELLGFKKPSENSIDTVSDRDYVLEILFNNSLILMHLSRLCEELIYYSSAEFAYVRFDDRYSTGSSIMPQKKNPDIAELIRGKSGRVYGDLVSLLTVLKATPLSYNKDFQEDKEPLFDSVQTTLYCLRMMAPMLSTLKINKEALRKSAELGYLNATDLADYLVGKGLPFRTAYEIVGQLVNQAMETGRKLEEIELAEYQTASEVFDEDLYAFIDLEAALNHRSVYGGPGAKAVKIQIANLEQSLAQLS